MRLSVIASRSLAIGFFVVAAACSSQSTGTAEETTPQNPTTVTTPSSNLEVKATLTAATLGEDCGEAKGSAGISADCAPSPDGGSCGGTSFCQQSNMQFTFAVSGSTGSAKVQIVSAKLFVKGEADPFDTLDSREPQVFTSNAYAAWDEVLVPGPEVKASYKLSAPDWNALSKRSSGTSLYSQEYELEVVISIDGVKRTMRISALYREAQVAT